MDNVYMVVCTIPYSLALEEMEAVFKDMKWDLRLDGMRG